ncbi:MAG: glycosyltransferase family 4 protein, partial [Thermoleophilaceae bacterium]
MRRAVMGLLFFPRGGSAQVARYLARALPGAGWEAVVACGSLGGPGDQSHAETFYRGVDVRPLDYTRAAATPDPLAADPPFQPSYEDRPGAPDRVFARVGEGDYERLVSTWEAALAGADAGTADVLHLHHLTPIHEAAERAFPDLPRIGHLHGTELLMLREIDEGPPAGWDHAAAWAERMRRWARGCERLLVLSPDAVRRVPELLGVDAARVVWAPNGFDPEGFERRPVDGADRLAVWRRWLVDEPRGWDESGETVRYREEQLEPFRAGGPVLLYVGRFTAVKRVPLLIRAHARARERFERPAPLVLLGGFPGEWEGEHPLAAVRETGNPAVFLAGWRGHDDLPQGLNAADLLVLPSVREQFGA